MKCRENSNLVTVATIPSTISSQSSPSFKCSINNKKNTSCHQECKILDTNNQNSQNNGTTNNNISSQDVSTSNSSHHHHHSHLSSSSPSLSNTIRNAQGKYPNCCSTSTSTVYTINTVDSGYTGSDGIDINSTNDGTDSTKGENTLNQVTTFFIQFLISQSSEMDRDG